MCVIINVEDGKFPDFKTLQDAESLNSHGGSIAWLYDGKINYHKGITAKKVNSMIQKKLKPSNVKTAIIHFRIASVGKVNQRLCHPFPISNNVNTKLKVMDSKHDLLFHNGTISNWQDILIEAIQGNICKIPKGELSDSRIMAYLINTLGYEFLKTVIDGNRFSILTKQGIIKYGKWVKIGDNQCSNDYFVKSKFYEIDDIDIIDDEKYNGDPLGHYINTKKDFKEYNKICSEFEDDLEDIDMEILLHLEDGCKLKDIGHIIQLQLEQQDQFIY